MKTLSKNSKILIILILLSVIIYSFSTRHTSNSQSTYDKIIGSWVLDSDTKSLWLFTLENKCQKYYNGVLLNTYGFSITNTSCSNIIDSEYEYLKLIKNTGGTYCYAINGITQEGNDKYLSIEYDGNPTPMLFKKQ
jgi:hypothetical protein